MINILGFDSDFDPSLLDRIVNEKKRLVITTYLIKIPLILIIT